MNDQVPQLVPIRQLSSAEPAIIAPYEIRAWASARRLKPCEIYALPAGAPPECFAPEWWTPLFRRDVTFWPVDAWSGHIFTLLHINLAEAHRRGHSPFKALRWAWGHPAADELGMPAATIETLWGV